MRDPVLAWSAFVVGVLLLLAGLVIIGWQLCSLVSSFWRVRVVRRSAPPVDAALTLRAAAVVDDLAARAGVDAPPVRVVPFLGVPLRNDTGVGARGLAETRIVPGRPVNVVFAAAAFTRLSSSALDSLAAHELAHVIDIRSRPLDRHAWSAGYLIAMAAVPLATVGLPVSLHLTVAGCAVLVLVLRAAHAAVRQRAEVAADLFALDLTGDLDGAEELMRVVAGTMYPERAHRPFLLRLLDPVARRVADHPEPQVRIAAMRQHLERGGALH